MRTNTEAQRHPPAPLACVRITQGVIHRGFWGLLRCGETKTSRGEKKESKRTTQGGMGRGITSLCWSPAGYLQVPCFSFVVPRARAPDGRHRLRDAGGCVAAIGCMHHAAGDGHRRAALSRRVGHRPALPHHALLFGSLPERPMQHKNKRSSAQTNNVSSFA